MKTSSHALVLACLLAATIRADDTPPGPAAMDKDQLQKIHSYFSASCFNNCWTLFDKPDRTPEEIEDMLLLAQASLWHWKQRTDCQPSNLAIGYWQVSRAYCLANNYELSRQFAEKCLSLCEEAQLSPFDRGYAYEALARAEVLHKDTTAARAHLAKARTELDKVTDKEERALLEADLTALEKAVTNPS